VLVRQFAASDLGIPRQDATRTQQSQRSRRFAYSFLRGRREAPLLETSRCGRVVTQPRESFWLNGRNVNGLAVDADEPTTAATATLQGEWSGGVNVASLMLAEGPSKGSSRVGG
jgi:hypothetical protein